MTARERIDALLDPKSPRIEIGAFAADGPVADLVDGDGHAGFTGPAGAQITALLVQVGQGQPRLQARLADFHAEDDVDEVHS